jgi:hypothetical protein
MLILHYSQEVFPSIEDGNIQFPKHYVIKFLEYLAMDIPALPLMW